MKPLTTILSILFLLPITANGALQKILSWGDQGDGTYKNPILKSDYSDPDILRHGNDFYLIASDFHFVGMQILHSKDLVNWKIIGRIFTRLSMDPKYDAMKGYGQGTWAPALRYHNGEFYVYVCTPADGLFMWHTKNPAGPWSETVTVKATPRWEDPCPFWDDDGQAYLIHSHVGAGPLILHKMSEDGTKLLDDGKEIYRGQVAEGPKLYKRNGYYYISLPEGGVDSGWQAVLRSKNIYGPYERKQVFPPGSPHQGSLVGLDSGETWFLSFKSTGYLGRICYLNPVKWTDDDWPVFGSNGQPVDSWKKPNVGQTHPVSHPKTSDGFAGSTLSFIWQWNHNPIPDAWSLTKRPGWLRLTAQPAAALNVARNTLTQKIWDSAGIIDVKMDVSLMKDGQRAGFAFMCGNDFGWIGTGQDKGTRRIMWDQGEGPIMKSNEVWFRGIYDGDTGRLLYSLDGKSYIDTAKTFRLFFRFWKGARIAIFNFGPNGGSADFDYVHYKYNITAKALGLKDVRAIVSAPKSSAPAGVDRKAWVTRHNPTLKKYDATSPLSVGNGGFAFGVDITGLQTFADLYYREGMPLETLSRGIWHTQPNPNHYKLSDANRNFIMPDGRELGFPTNQSSPAGDWLRKNPHNHPLGQLALEWVKEDGSTLAAEDIQNPEQTLDLWRGVITTRFKLGGKNVSVTTLVSPDSDTIGLRINSPLVREGKLRVRLAFPRGYDMNVKNTPALDWSHPESHQSVLLDTGPATAFIKRTIDETRYSVIINAPATRVGPHEFRISGDGVGETLDFAVQFLPGDKPAPVALSSYAKLLLDATAHWEQFWNTGAAIDFSGSTNPLAQKLEERIVLSLYLMAAQMAGEVPPQESGLACSTWYGKHHTEMIWWHAAHFALWGHDELLAKNLEWYRARLPEAQALAVSRGLRGARWAKMVGPDDRESPGGNPLIIWNQPHLVYLAELLYRNRPIPKTLAKYRELVFETAECLASMLYFDKQKGQYVLAPPLWIAQEIYDPASSRNPAFELSYWRWALGVAQQWRERLKLPRDKKWDDLIAHMAPLPTKEGKYVALESHPDTWDSVKSRQDHPSMLMPLGFLPGGPDVDRETMARTLDAVMNTWDWETKIWGWDYPMIAMTAARLGKPDLAMDVLLRNGPNNRYLPNGHCPQAGGDRKYEIAAYLPANGAFLSAVALMVSGWDGAKEQNPGIPKDGTWTVRTEGLRPLP
jgi:beta-xylosidase